MAIQRYKPEQIVNQAIALKLPASPKCRGFECYGDLSTTVSVRSSCRLTYAIHSRLSAYRLG
jgi:hypothetical protein